VVSFQNVNKTETEKCRPWRPFSTFVWSAGLHHKTCDIHTPWIVISSAPNCHLIKFRVKLFKSNAISKRYIYMNQFKVKISPIFRDRIWWSRWPIKCLSFCSCLHIKRPISIWDWNPMCCYSMYIFYFFICDPIKGQVWTFIHMFF
jgi:hypothetical protein